MLHAGGGSLREDGLVVDLALADGDDLRRALPLAHGLARERGEAGHVLHVPDLEPAGRLLEQVERAGTGDGCPADVELQRDEAGVGLGDQHVVGTLVAVGEGREFHGVVVDDDLEAVLLRDAPRFIECGSGALDGIEGLSRRGRTLGRRSGGGRRSAAAASFATDVHGGVLVAHRGVVVEGLLEVGAVGRADVGGGCG